MSWPWKKKSSDKAAVEKVAAILDSAGATLTAAKPQDDQVFYLHKIVVLIEHRSFGM